MSYFIAILSNPPRNVQLAAKTEHAAKIEARHHQSHLNPARINLYESQPGKFSRLAGFLLEGAKEWKMEHRPEITEVNGRTIVREATGAAVHFVPAYLPIGERS